MTTARLDAIFARCHGRAIWIGCALLLAACGGPPASPPPAVAAKPAVTPPAPAPVVMPKEPASGPALPPLTYEANGRRDPFVPVTVAKEKATGLAVESLKLAGVIRGRTLLALVEAADGLGYILKPGDALGDGRVTDITSDSVTFAVAGKSGQAATTVTLRLSAA